MCPDFRARLMWGSESVLLRSLARPQSVLFLWKAYDWTRDRLRVFDECFSPDCANFSNARGKTTDIWLTNPTQFWILDLDWSCMKMDSYISLLRKISLSWPLIVHFAVIFLHKISRFHIFIHCLMRFLVLKKYADVELRVEGLETARRLSAMLW